MCNRIFDVNLNEKLGYVKDAVFGLLTSVFWGVMGDQRPLASLGRFSLASALILVQVLVLAAVLCPLAIIYVIGIFMSGGISLWRLIEHDYRDNTNLDSNGEASNLAPAMDTLYYIALLQGVLFCYRFILGCSGKRLAKKASTNEYNDPELEVVTKYLHDTKIGCEKDPSFARGRNLITDAIDKIGSNSPDDCISGVKILYTVICIADRKLAQLKGKMGSDYRQQLDIVIGQNMLIKHLAAYASSSSRHILQKLLEKLDSRGLHNRETRKHAVKIVECLAFDINLEQFPEGIQHISSLLETFEQYSIAEPYQRDGPFNAGDQRWRLQVIHHRPSEADIPEKAYKELLLGGMRILLKLATNEKNCRVMGNTFDLIPKIMAPIIFDLIHHTTDAHGTWSDVVEVSMEVIIQLTDAPRETGAKLRHEISSCEEAISTMWRILNCTECNEGLQQRAILILTRLCMDTTESRRSADFVVLTKESSCSIKECFVRILMNIFTHDNKYSISTRAYAGGALSEICFRGGIYYSIIVIQISGDVVHSLINVLVHDKSKICRQAAAEILEHLCTHCTMDDECFSKLKKAMTDVIPEVIYQLLSKHLNSVLF